MKLQNLHNLKIMCNMENSLKCVIKCILWTLVSDEEEDFKIFGEKFAH